MSQGKRSSGKAGGAGGKKAAADAEASGDGQLVQGADVQAPLNVAAVQAATYGPGLQEPPADPLTEFFVGDDERLDVTQSYAADAFQTSAAREMTELLAFWVADEEYAVDILEIQEIIKLPVITEVPRTKSTVLGIISLRGTIVPALDLRRVLHLDERPATRATRILVLRAEGDPVGLLVDRVTSVVRIAKDDIEGVPRTMKADAGELVKGVGRLGERLLIVLELPAILSLMEQKA